MAWDFLQNEDQRNVDREPLIYYVKVWNQKDDSFFGFLVDISTSGVMLLSETHVDENQRFKFYIDLQKEFYLAGTLKFEAQSVWCKPDVNPDHHVIGFKFLALEPGGSDTVQYLIEKYGFNNYMI